MAEAAEVTRQAVAAPPAGHRARGAALADLSLVLLRRCPDAKRGPRSLR